MCAVMSILYTMFNPSFGRRTPINRIVLYCECAQLDLDSVWKYVCGVSTSAGPALTQLSGKHDVCIEAAGVLLAMVRTLLNMVIMPCLVEFIHLLLLLHRKGSTHYNTSKLT